MRNLLVIGLSVMLVACAADLKVEEKIADEVSNVSSKDIVDSDQVVITDKCVIDGHALTLLSKGSSAFLTVEDETLDLSGNLQLVPPCYFVRSKGEVLSYSYDDVDVSHVIVVTGNMASTELKEKYKVSESELCGEKAQGLVIKGKEMSISDYVLQGGITCKDYPLDEKNYWTFAHPKK